MCSENSIDLVCFLINSYLSKPNLDSNPQKDNFNGVILCTWRKPSRATERQMPGHVQQNLDSVYFRTSATEIKQLKLEISPFEAICSAIDDKEFTKLQSNIYEWEEDFADFKEKVDKGL